MEKRNDNYMTMEGHAGLEVTHDGMIRLIEEIFSDDDDNHAPQNC